MSSREEIRRLEVGVLPDETPGGIGTIDLIGLSDGHAETVAERTREMLRLVLGATTDEWPISTEWRSRLPQWFLDACAPQSTPERVEEYLNNWRAMSPEERAKAEAAERWTMEEFVDWLKPSERQWEFWACQASDENNVRLTIKIDSWPVAHGALDWLLRAAGADRVVAED